MAGSNQTSRTFELIVARAVIDSSFRERLLADKASVIREYQLTEKEVDAINQIDQAGLDAAREIATLVGVVHLNSGD